MLLFVSHFLLLIQEMETTAVARGTLYERNSSSGRDPTNLIVCYIPNELNDEELFEIFSQWGELNHARVIKDDVGASKGYGFVHFRCERDAAEAMKHMNGFKVYKKTFKITVAKGPKPKLPPPPPYASCS